METLKAIVGLLGMIGCLIGLVVAITLAVHKDYGEATFLLGIVIMYRVFDIPTKRGT